MERQEKDEQVREVKKINIKIRAKVTAKVRVRSQAGKADMAPTVAAIT